MWQPIETAPKDGTVFDVIPDLGYTQAFWQDGFWFWIRAGWYEDAGSIAAGPEPKGWKPRLGKPSSNVVSPSN